MRNTQQVLRCALASFLVFMVLVSSCRTTADQLSRAEKKRIEGYFKETLSFHEKKDTFSIYHGRMEIKPTYYGFDFYLDSIEIAFSIKQKSDSAYLGLFTGRLLFNSIGHEDGGKDFEICCFESLDFLNTKRTRRRFSFYEIFVDRLHLNTMNQYFFELTNDHADKHTDLKTFIKGARLTYMSFPHRQL